MLTISRPMPLTDQRQLSFPIHQRTVLVSVEMARAALGVDAGTIAMMVDDGRLRWVWDISAGGGLQRHLRIWAREIITPELNGFLPEAEVLDSVIGTKREHLRAVEVGQLLLCSRTHMLQLIRSGALSGPLTGHTQHITRTSLAAFLRARLAERRVLSVLP